MKYKRITKYLYYKKYRLFLVEEISYCTNAINEIIETFKKELDEIKKYSDSILTKLEKVKNKLEDIKKIFDEK
ncbi:MAG: hypothetical protein QXI58_00315 [Candidatus Micrarchaeia archaeon]|jgi:archaellum component FlaC